MYVMQLHLEIIVIKFIFQLNNSVCSLLMIEITYFYHEGVQWCGLDFNCLLTQQASSKPIKVVTMQLFIDEGGIFYIYPTIKTRNILENFCMYLFVLVAYISDRANTAMSPIQSVFFYLLISKAQKISLPNQLHYFVSILLCFVDSYICYQHVNICVQCDGLVLFAYL